MLAFEMSMRDPPATVARRYHLRIGGDPSEAGKRLDRFLADRLPELSRSRLKALIADGHVCLDGATITEPSRRVKPGDGIEIVVPPPAPAAPAAETLALDVAFEDAHIVVVNKPAGMVVHPAPGNREHTLVNALLAHCRGSLSGIGGVERPGIVHRLDKDTSGLMVVAKSDAAHQGLVRQFAGRVLSRRYHALVWGVPRPAEGRIDAPVGRSPHNRTRMAVVAAGREAITDYAVIARLAGPTALVDCALSTGRTHQIRVHLAHIGHPLVGDPVYGGRSGRRPPSLGGPADAHLAAFRRQALHAWRLAFRHPVTGEEIVVTRDEPGDLEELIQALQL